MEWFITATHIFLCVILMIVILLQAGKGAEIGAVFGGSSQTIFGSRGAATFLSKVTSVCAIGFMITSLTLVWISSQASKSTIMEPAGQSETSGAAAGSGAEEGESAKPAAAEETQETEEPAIKVTPKDSPTGKSEESNTDK